MAASYGGAVAAIRARLVTNWTTTRIVYQNETPVDPWPPVNGSNELLPFVSLEVLGSGSDIVGQGVPGHHRYTYPGLINVHVFVPVGAGEALARQYADQIGEIFRAATFYDDVQPGCYVRSGIGPGDAPHQDGGGQGDDDGNWFRVTEIIGFDYWHRG